MPVTWLRRESVAVSLQIETKPKPPGAGKVRRKIAAIPPEAREAAIESLRALGELGARLGGTYALGAQLIAEDLEGLPGARVTLLRAAIRALAVYCAPDTERATAEAIQKKLKDCEAGRRGQACAEEVRLMHTVLMNTWNGRAPGFETIRDALGGVGKVADTKINLQSANHNEESTA